MSAYSTIKDIVKDIVDYSKDPKNMDFGSADPSNNIAPNNPNSDYNAPSSQVLDNFAKKKIGNYFKAKFGRWPSKAEFQDIASKGIQHYTTTINQYKPSQDGTVGTQTTVTPQNIANTPEEVDKYSLNLTESDDPIVKMQQELLQYSSELKKPYMEWGDEAMAELQEGIKNQAFTPDGKAIENFQFKELLDDFDIKQYEGQRPEITKFKAGDAPEMYDTGEAYTPQGQAPQFQGEDVYQRQDYTGRDIPTEYEQYQGQKAPDARQITNQFQTQDFQAEGQRPDIFRAGDAPKSEYYDPSGGVKPVYQGKEFNVQDDPGYQRRYDKAMGAIEASAAAKGMQLSGATLKALQEEAANIASEETQAAYARHADQRGFEAGQSQEEYGREQAQQDRIQNAMQYKNADQYQRYLDSIGIRRDEQQQMIQQFESDRAFGANQNKEKWLREQASKQLGRELNNDEFQRWQATEGQNFAQYANQRDWTTSQANLAADQDWQQHTYNTGFDAAQSDKQFDRDLTQYQADTDQYRWGEGMKKSAEQENYERDKALYGDQAQMYQYQTGVDFGADQAFQNAQQNAYTQDKGDFYNLQNQQWQQKLNNLNAQNQFQGQQYGQLQDIYGMDAANKGQQYGMLKDTVNTGLAGQDASVGMAGNYANFATDWDVNQTNLANAKKKQKSDNVWNTMNFLSNVLG